MSITLALAGDTMLGRDVAKRLAAVSWHDLFATAVRDRFAAADLAVLNLECCISARGRPWSSPGKMFHFRAPPKAADLLALLGVDCVTLANNHALDYGHEAFLDTLEHLENAGFTEHQVEPLDFAIEYPSFDDWWAAQRDLSRMLASALEAAGPEAEGVEEGDHLGVGGAGDGHHGDVAGLEVIEGREVGHVG